MGIYDGIGIYSFGGCGTSALREALGIPKHCAGKHLREPPDLPPGYKLGYVYGDPRNAVLSFIRRGICKSHGKNLDVNIQQMTIDQYISNGRDVFKLEEHFDNWVTKKGVILIKYETMFDHLDEIGAYFSRDISLDRSDRYSDWSGLPMRVGHPLRRMHLALIRKMKAMPPIVIQ